MKDSNSLCDGVDEEIDKELSLEILNKQWAKYIVL